MNKIKFLILFLILGMEWLNAAAGVALAFSSNNTNSCGEYVEVLNENLDTKDNGNILFHFFRNTKCPQITYEDLLKVSIIDNRDEVSEVAYLNVDNKFNNNGCCVTKEYKSKFSDVKNVDINKNIEFVNFIKNNKESEFIFKGKCSMITKKVLVDNYILRPNEINKKLRYQEEVCIECGEKYYNSTCSIFKDNK